MLKTRLSEAILEIRELSISTELCGSYMRVCESSFEYKRNYNEIENLSVKVWGYEKCMSVGEISGLTWIYQSTILQKYNTGNSFEAFLYETIKQMQTYHTKQLKENFLSLFFFWLFCIGFWFKYTA